MGSKKNNLWPMLSKIVPTLPTRLRLSLLHSQFRNFLCEHFPICHTYLPPFLGASSGKVHPVLINLGIEFLLTYFLKASSTIIIIFWIKNQFRTLICILSLNHLKILFECWVITDFNAITFIFFFYKTYWGGKYQNLVGYSNTSILRKMNARFTISLWKILQ